MPRTEWLSGRIAWVTALGVCCLCPCTHHVLLLLSLLLLLLLLWFLSVLLLLSSLLLLLWCRSAGCACVCVLHAR